MKIPFTLIKKTFQSIVLASGLSCSANDVSVPHQITTAVEQADKKKITPHDPALPQSIEEYIEQHKEQWLTEDYMPFLRLDCTSAKQGEDLAGKTKCASYLENLLLQKGFSPQIFVGTDTPAKELLKKSVETGLLVIRPVVYAEILSDPVLPSILFDTHYDGRPVNDNPNDPWETDPFEPVRKKVVEEWNNGKIEDERIYARRAVDSAGHVMSIIWAIEAYQSVHGTLPVNVKVMFEGAEEIGSPGMKAFVTKYQEQLKADLVVIDDIWTNRPGIPLISQRLRGSLGGEICVQTATKEGHSGSGSYIPNALGFLSRLMDTLVDPITKNVALSSYMNSIRQPTVKEIDFVHKLLPSWTETERKNKYGVQALVGNTANTTYSPAVRTILLPSWDWEMIPEHKNGAEGVIPSLACVSFKARLVPSQQPEVIFSELEQWLEQQPEAKYAKITATMTGGYPAFTAELDNQYTPLVRQALLDVFKTSELEIDWNGAGEPIASYFQSILRVPVFLIGYGHPNDNAHATNESMLVKHGLLLGVKGNTQIMEKIGGK